MKKNNKEIIESFYDACQQLADAVNKQLFNGYRDWYWVGDEIGGICDYEDLDFLTPEEMVLIIQNNINYDAYAEWRNYNLDNPEKRINLSSWINGFRG